MFFHGGNFQTGASNDWPGYLLATKGIVVVTANYRLGAFGNCISFTRKQVNQLMNPLCNFEGFLSLGGGDANFGLWDQHMVLQWVQKNIHAFNGDFNRVTIVGHDAGAVSAGLHTLSPFSSGGHVYTTYILG